MNFPKIMTKRTGKVERAAETPVPRRSGEQRSSSEHFPSKLFGFVGNLTQDMPETIPATTSHPSLPLPAPLSYLFC